MLTNAKRPVLASPPLSLRLQRSGPGSPLSEQEQPLPSGVMRLGFAIAPNASSQLARERQVAARGLGLSRPPAVTAPEEWSCWHRAEEESFYDLVASVRSAVWGMAGGLGSIGYMLLVCGISST